ncbi:MAG TPA: PEP/pyruvate-binding domain-containing protein [Verrucomicrobiales bacterium]|nr:PEP/pyruvate-binding domain-containing protein [Verrucomicrobiales bacterium]
MSPFFKFWRHLAVLCLILNADAAQPDFTIASVSRDARNRTQVGVAPDSGSYHILLRGARPDLCTFPVDMRLGDGGKTRLYDSMPAQRSAFFTVKSVPVATPLDTDGDGTNDVAELQNPLANPLNPARVIAAADGAIIAPTRELFDSISHRDNFPGAPNVREVKFLIMGADTANPALYFLNANKHVYHYYFARDVLGYTGSLSTFNNSTYFTNGPGRKQMAGSLIVHESWQPPGGGTAGIMTMEFWPSDAVGYSFVQKAYDLISRALPFLETRLAYHAASETQRTLYRTERALYDAAVRDRMHLITTEELFGQTNYTMLNPGVGFGRLLLYDGSAPLTVRDIVIFRTLPNEITRTAGIITETGQTPLSHINLKAKQDNIPNAFIRSASTDARIAPLLGKNVRFEPLPDGFAIREATQQEVEEHLEALRPDHPQFPVRDLTKTTIQPLSALGFSSASGFGAKTANVAELRKFLPPAMVPNGYGIPFYFYDEFMKYHGLYAEAQTMIEDPLFASDAAYREAKLAIFRDRIKDAFLPDSIWNSLTTLQNNFPAGTPIRCRSSTNNEDLEGFSGAGLYDSYTHRPTEGHLSKTVKQVWASLWTLRAFDERDFYRVDHFAAAMGVLVHPNTDDEKANGVGVTKNIIDPNWTGYYVNAQLGENLVTNPGPNDIPEEFLIAELDGGTRYTIQHVTYSNLVPEGQTVITTAQAEQLADRMKSIRDHFRPLYGGDFSTFAMEIEWKVTTDNQLFIKQARPWVE